MTAGPRELIARAYFTGYDTGLRGALPRYRPPAGLPERRAELLTLLYARGYRLGRIAAGLPLPATSIRDELTETLSPPA